MRRLAPLILILTAGCQAVGAPGAPLLAIPAAVEGVALRAFGRTIGDSVVSLVTGEDCSIARIGRGEAYCGRDDAPAPPPLCTRSLGAVDCWTLPPAGYPAYRGVADGPATLTEAQENNRIGWTGRIARAMRPAPAPDQAAAPAAPAPATPPVPVIEPGPGTPVAPTLPTVAGEAAQRALTARPLPDGAQPNDRPVAPLLVPAEGGNGRGDVRRLLEP
jgi:hypothetical protein